VNLVLPFEETHRVTELMAVRDTDGRQWNEQAPRHG
jgi:hypothetical protein